MASIIVVFVAACLTSMAFSAVVLRVAPMVGLTDHPDGHRKLHEQSIPLGGGVGVFLATCLVLGGVLTVSTPWKLSWQENWKDVLPFLAGCGGIVLLGVVDDRCSLRGRHKLVGQLVATGLIMFGGLVIERIGLFGHTLELGIIGIPFTLFWLLGAINSVNLLDGIDGLATSIGIVLSATISCMAAMQGNYGVAVVALVLTGSLTGFLPYNLPPARMYLGDAGSMLIGLMVGAMAIRGMLKGPGTVLLAAPLAIWAIPIIDSGAAIIRRVLTGRSILKPDRGHMHHRLFLRLGSNQRVLAVIVLCCVATSAGALLSVFVQDDTYALVACLAVLAMLIVTGLFGGAELNLVLSRARSLGSSLAHPTRVTGRGARESRVRIQGHEDWEILWETLTESAQRLSLARLRLDLNAPALHEGYVATWESPDYVDPDLCWSVNLPLSVADMRVGHLTVGGRLHGSSGLGEIAQLLDMLEPFESRLQRMAQRPPVSSSTDLDPSAANMIPQETLR